MFGERLKEIRQNANEKQEDLGNFLGVAKNSISNWENGISEPSFENLKKIAKHYNVSTDFLHGIDYSKVEKLKNALRENGFAVGDDLTIEQLDKALKIIDMMEDTKK